MAVHQSPKREEIEARFKWNLQDIYADDAAWEEDYERMKSLLEKAARLQGQLGQSAPQLLGGLRQIEVIDRLGEKLLVYARMRRDENNADNRYQALYDRAESLMIQANSTMSFVTPELTEISAATLSQYMEEVADLKLYRHMFDEIMRQKEHVLSKPEEKILALSADLALAAGNIFTMLNNADIKFGLIHDENGQEVELTKGRYGRFMESHDRRVREEAFHTLYSAYGRLENTLAASLSASVKKDVFYARVRNYPSARHASLKQDNVEVEVYDQLIESVHEHMDDMYRYLRLRRQILNLDELHMYDIYVPLVKEYQVKIPYEKAQEQVLEALQPLGEEYLDILKAGLSGGWIDVYENQGKTSGAYSWGCYDSHPYVLLNYDSKLDDVFTLAHEMGHALHSYYSNRHQPYVYSQYTIFLAEVASTVNESLLIDYLLQRCSSREERVYLINHYLEQFRGTVYRQTMFAEYEKIIHDMVEQGQPLTTEALKQSYMDLNRLYYGPDVVIDEDINMEWARIPHFYSAFYVYKYATGFSAATAIKEQIQNEGPAAVERYLAFLKSGSSAYPVELLKKAGVDLTSRRPVQAALEYFGRLVNELEEAVSG
jgi:oligoendopeptidase F